MNVAILVVEIIDTIVRVEGRIHLYLTAVDGAARHRCLLRLSKVAGRDALQFLAALGINVNPVIAVSRQHLHGIAVAFIGVNEQQLATQLIDGCAVLKHQRSTA